AERGRRRRDEENKAKQALADQIARTAPSPECHVLALFGEVVSDTLLLARNLGADAVAMAGRAPDLPAMLRAAPRPGLLRPPGCSSPGPSVPTRWSWPAGTPICRRCCGRRHFRWWSSRQAEAPA